MKLWQFLILLVVVIIISVIYSSSSAKDRSIYGLPLKAKNIRQMGNQWVYFEYDNQKFIYKNAGASSVLANYGNGKAP